jgi:hypothetical protein
MLQFFEGVRQNGTDKVYLQMGAKAKPESNPKFFYRTCHIS